MTSMLTVLLAEEMMATSASMSTLRSESEDVVSVSAVISMITMAKYHYDGHDV